LSHRNFKLTFDQANLKDQKEQLMKKILQLITYIILGTIFFSVELYSQNPIPNPGLESWTGNIPNGWSAPTNIPQASIEPITKSPEAYGDSWAARGFVLDAFGTPISPLLYTGTISEPFFPVSANHSVLSCFYKFFPVGGDMLFIEVVFLNQTVGGGGEGHAMIATNNEQIYSKIEIPITYADDNPPGWQAEFANITITILPQEGQDPHAGTWFLVDNFTFDNLPIILDVKEVDDLIPTEFKLEQNFPNPFNPVKKFIQIK
jgi:hypothetical protein